MDLSSARIAPPPPPLVMKLLTETWRLWIRVYPEYPPIHPPKLELLLEDFEFPEDTVSLVSTYIVCESLSVMQRQARLPEFFDQIAKNTLFLAGQELPP